MVQLSIARVFAGQKGKYYFILTFQLNNQQNVACELNLYKGLFTINAIDDAFFL